MGSATEPSTPGGITIKNMKTAQAIHGESRPPAFTFTLLPPWPPTGATVNASSGLISWHPLVAPGGATINSTFRVKVDDNGTPNLSATNSFTVTVFQPSQAPTVDSLFVNNGKFTLSVSGDAGLDYTLLASTKLVQWTPLITTNSATPSVWLTDPLPMTKHFFHDAANRPAGAVCALALTH